MAAATGTPEETQFKLLLFFLFFLFHSASAGRAQSSTEQELQLMSLWTSQGLFSSACMWSEDCTIFRSSWVFKGSDTAALSKLCHLSDLQYGSMKKCLYSKNCSSTCVCLPPTRVKTHFSRSGSSQSELIQPINCGLTRGQAQIKFCLTFRKQIKKYSTLQHSTQVNPHWRYWFKKKKSDIERTKKRGKAIWISN